MDYETKKVSRKQGQSLKKINYSLYSGSSSNNQSDTNSPELDYDYENISVLSNQNNDNLSNSLLKDEIQQELDDFFNKSSSNIFNSSIVFSNTLFSNMGNEGPIALGSVIISTLLNFLKYAKDGKFNSESDNEQFIRYIGLSAFVPLGGLFSSLTKNAFNFNKTSLLSQLDSNYDIMAKLESICNSEEELLAMEEYKDALSSTEEIKNRIDYLNSAKGQLTSLEITAALSFIISSFKSIIVGLNDARELGMEDKMWQFAIYKFLSDLDENFVYTLGTIVGAYVHCPFVGCLASFAYEESWALSEYIATGVYHVEFNRSFDPYSKIMEQYKTRNDIDINELENEMKKYEINTIEYLNAKLKFIVHKNEIGTVKSLLALTDFSLDENVNIVFQKYDQSSFNYGISENMGKEVIDQYGEVSHYGMNSLGYVQWVLKNAGFSLPKNGVNSLPMGKILDANFLEWYKTGDILVNGYRYAIITNLDTKNNTITFVECSEKEGKVISKTMSLDDCCKEFDKILNMNRYYGNINNLCNWP